MSALPEGLDALLARPQFRLPTADKVARLGPVLAALTARHRAACPAYARLLDLFGRPPAADAAGRPVPLADVPLVPVGLFKTHRLASVPDEAVFKELRSSGTTGQVPSRVVLDRPTARLQARALAAIAGTLLGGRRRPMVVLDHEGVVRGAPTARTAAVLGFLPFGRDHFFALDADLRLRREALAAWLDRHAGEDLLLFGFTFLAWRALAEEAAGLDLSRGLLLHGGGWKRLADRAVDAPSFKRRLREATGLARVHDYYGMVEQTGSIFLEDDRGRLTAPHLAHVLVRDPDTLRPLPPGEVGVIEVLSALPLSYPGHAILTEDLGVIEAEDDPDHPWRGQRFRVLGRVPTAEARGCSDTRAVPGGAA